MREACRVRLDVHSDVRRRLASPQHYDAQRDVVIRRSRDMQKAAKTAIYCLHRGDGQGADRDLALVEAAAAELQPIIDAEPTLRQGGFSASIEEYAGALRCRRRGVCLR